MEDPNETRSRLQRQRAILDALFPWLLAVGAGLAVAVLSGVALIAVHFLAKVW